MKRRILSIICALALCLTLLPGTAWAAEEWTYSSGTPAKISDGETTLTVTRSNQNLTITGVSTLASLGVLVLPTEAKNVDGGDTYTVTSIGTQGFKGCTGLTSVTVPDGINIGNSAFANCTNLKSVTLPTDLAAIPSSLFSDCTSLTDIALPEKITSIGNYAFQNCTSLTSITVPSGVTSIGSDAFYGCTSLERIELPESMTSIGAYAFQNCTSLTDITLPENITKIDSATFRDCTSLTSITVPGAVSVIGYYAFYGCTSLKEMTVLAATPPTLDSAAFGNATSNSLTAIYVPAESVDAYKGADVWKNFADKIKSIVEESMTLTPDSASWEGEYGTDFDLKEFTITNEGEDALTNISVTLDTTGEDNFTLDTAGMANSLDAKGQTTFTVTPNSDLAVDTYEATVTVTAKAGDETETKEATLTCKVTDQSLSGAQVQVSGSYTYNEQAHTPSGNDVTVTLGDKTLTENEDYTLSYENNTDAGEATVKATGKGNYTGYAEGTFTIAPATLTVTGVTATSRDYNGSNTVAITGVTLSGKVGNDEVSVDMSASGLTGTVDSPDVGTYNTLTLSGTVTLTGADKDNYTLTLPTEPVTVTGGVTISQATASISFNNYAPGKTYDGTALAVPTAEELKLSGAVYTDVEFTWYKGTSADGAKLDSAPADAGTYYLVASIPASANTSADSATSGAITIRPAEISIQSATLKTKTYDGETAAEVESVEFTGAAVLPGEGDYTVKSAAFADKNAGDSKTGSVTVELTSGNFTFAGNQDEATYASATGTIDKLPVVLEWDYTTEFTYDGQPHSVIATIKNVVDGDTVTLNHTNNSETNKGTYTATVALAGTDAGNYTLDGVENASLTWHIAGASIDTATVALTPTTATYDGSDQTPGVAVKLGDKELTGTDYTVAYTGADGQPVSNLINAGDYTVTVTGTGNYEGTATATFTIQKADPNIGDVTYSGGDLYDSTALDSITLSRGNQTTVSGTLELDAGQILRADVSSYKWTFTPDDAANYETITGTVELTVQTDTLTGLSVQTNPDKTEYVYGETFDTTGLVLEATYASNNTKEISAEEITVETTGPLTCDMTEVTVSYQGKTCTVPVTVGKATYSGQTTVTGTIWANTASEVQLPQPPDGATFGNPVYSVDSDTVVRVEITGNTLAYEGGTGITEGQKYEITVPVDGGTNYNNYQITVTLIGTDKKVPTGAPTLSTTTITYGQSLSTITLSGSMQDGAETVTGTFAWADPDETPNAGSYEARWTFTPDNGDLYEPGSGTVTITVNKATPRGTPKYTAITTSGKTLADAGLTTEGGTFSVPGTVAWEQADTTQVQANTAYTWKFTPDDRDNYNSISGSVTLYTVSSGGGGGGGSSSSNITTETTKNPDGSTTTTVTNKTNGTVTETTKWPDGSKEVIETKKDGTVTTTTTDAAGNKTEVVENTDGSSRTTVDNKDGSGSVTVVDENGNVVSSATLSQSAVETAQQTGEAVALPMPEVPVTTDRETAPTITVNLPLDGSVKVEILVEDVTAGTVAVLVKSNGDEEIIKTSVTTGNGVTVTLNDGDTVKIVDNSRDFADVPDNYWGAEAVDFAVSRELFAGTSATTFSPNTAMNRAMIVTVLARFEGVDTATGSTWYEAGQQWAMENGISDGSNMEQGLTREQLATMLYRYAQAKGYDTTQGGMAIREYADFEQISGYAAEAMTWAVNTGIINGTSSTTLSPQGPATRAQVATILMRFIETGI